MASVAPNAHVHIPDKWPATAQRVIESCAVHDHICLIYETREEQLAAVVPFFKAGLERREKCIYVVDDNPPEVIAAALRADGVDVDAALASDGLSIIPRNEAYLKNGDFDPGRMIAHIKQAIDAAEAEGYTSFRITGETTWALCHPKYFDPLIEYECRLNEFFPKENVLAICQYNRRRFRPETLLRVIRTHPFVICNGLVCENPHYIPPDAFDPGKYDAATEVEGLLDGITQNAQLRQDLAAEAEQANRLSVEAAHWRQLYDAVLANTPDHGCIFDLDHRFTYANGALLAVLGRKWEDVIGKTCLELGFEPWHVARHDREIKQVIATRKPIRGELPFTGANGRRIYDYIFFPVIGPTGEVEAVGGTTRDITERKQAEEALRESEQRFRTIVDTTPECVKLVAADGTLLHMNSAGLGMIGADSADMVVGKSVYDLIAPEHRGEYRSFNERICGGEKGSLQFDIVGLHGVGRHLETHAAPFRTPDGEVVQLGLARDITERKETEQALRESERRLEAELAAMHQLQSISLELSHEENTDSLCEKLLDAAVAIMRSDFASMQMLYPERGAGGELRLLAHRGFDSHAMKFWEWVRADSNCSCGAALRTRKRAVVTNVEHCEWMAGTSGLEAYRKAGIRSAQTTPLISRSGQLLGMISTHWREPHQPSERDLRTMDIIARQAADLLDRKLATERQRQSEAALRKSEKFAAAGRMAATIAHEINNPLEAVMNLSYLLGQENLSSTGKELVRALESELKRVSHITKQTLGFYRDSKTAGPVKLAEPINDAVVLFSRKAESQGAKIETQFNTSASLFGFSGELRQVFANLISNALEAGASTIKIRVSPGRETVNGRRTGVRVLVADDGSGIPAGAVGKLFEPFFTTKEEKGTGLGLWVSKGIVQRHEGWIRARTSTRPGRNGTSFCLFLPTLKERSGQAD